MPGAVVYCRVSTKEQAQTLSLSIQEKQCRVYCQQQGFSVERVFVDDGRSGKTVNRPEFQKLLLYCRENKKKVNFVVVYSLNRFSRVTKDHHEIKALLSTFGVKLRSATEPIDDSSSGKLMEGMYSVLAQWDNDVRSERTIAGMRAAAERGRWTFPAPIGYRMVSTAGHSRMEHDPDRAPLVCAAFELFATGNYDQDQVLRKVTSRGLRTRRGKKLTLQTFSAMLRKPIYAGRLLLPRWGIDRVGDFQPVISEDVFHRVQAILSGRRSIVGPYRRDNPDFPLRHFIKCAFCDRPLTASWSKNRFKTRYGYYRCPDATCKLNISKPRLEEDFIELLKRLQPKAKYLRLFEAVVLDVWKTQQSEAIRTAKDVRKRIDQILQRKDRLNEAYLYERTVDSETYQSQLARLREEHAFAEMELSDARVDELDIETAINFALTTIGDASSFWIGATNDQKLEFQRVMFPKGLTFNGKTIGTPVTCLAFSYLREVSSPQSRLASRTGVEPVSPP